MYVCCVLRLASFWCRSILSTLLLVTPGAVPASVDAKGCPIPVSVDSQDCTFAAVTAGRSYATTVCRHQAVRWLNTKEEHAGRKKPICLLCRPIKMLKTMVLNGNDCCSGIIENMSSYMLAQRIKPPAEASGPKQEQYISLLVVGSLF